MRRVISLYRTSVGKKFYMAVSGFILIGFLVAHMVGMIPWSKPRDAIVGVWSIARQVFQALLGNLPVTAKRPRATKTAAAGPPDR